MQITGSPQRLLLSVAVFVILLTMIWYFPGRSLRCALVAGQAVPSLACCALFAYLGNDRTMVLVATASGAFLGFLLSPTVWRNGELQTWFDDYWQDWLLWPLNSAVGALIAGVAILAFDFATRRLTSRDR